MPDSSVPAASTQVVLGGLTMEQTRRTVQWAAACPALAAACEGWLKTTAERSAAARVRASDVAVLPRMTGAQAMEAARRHLRGLPGRYLVSSGSGSHGQRSVRALTGHGSYAPQQMDWLPLQPGDVLLNCYPAGGAYLHTERHAERHGVHTVPAGSDLRQVAGMADQLRDIGVNVVAGYPRTLVAIAEQLTGGRTLPALRTALWTGEHLTVGAREALCELNSGIELWGTYSSAETGCVAVGWPDCTPGVLHLCPGQLVELTPRECLLTRAAEPGADRPLVRMPLGDQLAAARCDCPRTLPALRVVGRVAHTIRLRATDLPVDGLWLAAADSPEVTGAQLLAVPADPADPAGTMLRLGLRVQPRAARATDPGGTATRAADRVLTRHPQLRAVISRAPDAFFTEAAPLELLSSGKTRPIVVLPATP